MFIFFLYKFGQTLYSLTLSKSYMWSKKETEGVQIKDMVARSVIIDQSSISS